MGDLLDTIGGSKRGTGVYRLVSSILLTALTITVVLVGWFARDELELFRNAQAAVITQIRSHIEADLESRSSLDNRAQALDLRVSKMEQSRDDVSLQANTNQINNMQQIQQIQTTLSGVERELSKIEGKLGVDHIGR